jgi:Flp pilus assembly protein TadD
VAAAAIACIVLDWRQIAIWHDSVTLWRHVLVHEPKSALARMCLGEEWHDRGDLDRAEAEFRASLAIKESPRTRDWLGLVLAAKGRLAEAYESHAAATRLDPGFWEAHNNAGIALARMGRMREAVERFEQAAQRAPADEEVQSNLLRARAELRQDRVP